MSNDTVTSPEKHGKVLKSELEPRAKVPRATVTLRYTDERKALADEADTANPKFKHVYKGPNASAEELARHKLQPVKYDEMGREDLDTRLAGQTVVFRGDTLHRQLRDEYDETKLRGETISKDLVQQSMQDTQEYEAGNPAHEQWRMGEEQRDMRSVDELNKRRR